ncbi:MAG: DNA alkylation repair protein [Candidatus Eisenbacteria bacterium]
MTGAGPLDPRKKARETLRVLRSLRDPSGAAAGQRFFKEPVDLLGIRAAVLDRLAKEIVRETRRIWSWRDAVLFCDLLAKDPHLEARALGYTVVGAFVEGAEPSLLPRIRGWLEKSCGSWAAVDTLAPRVLGPLLDHHPDRIPEVAEWTEAKSLWVRRAAIVAFVPHARRGKHLGAVYEIAGRLLGDEEDLIHKAVGWVLREAGKADAARLERWLRKHGPRIPRTTLRYAIERFPEKKRKSLLEATRPKGRSDSR